MATESKATAKAPRKKGAKTVAREYFEAIGRRDLDAMTDLWEPGGKGTIHGLVDLQAPATLREWFGNLFRAFPDFEMEILDVVAAGEQAAVRWRAVGTFSGPVSFEGLYPTGARVEMEGCDLLTIADGKIRDNRAYMNESELARQMGAMPPSGSIGEKLMLGSVNARTAAATAVRRLRKRD